MHHFMINRNYLSKIRGTAINMVGLIKEASPSHPFLTFNDLLVKVNGDEYPT